jgi:hypothetical protein
MYFVQLLMKKMDGTLGMPAQLDEKIKNIIKKADEEHQRVWAEYEKIPDEKMKEKFLDDYMRKAEQ